MGLFHRHEWKKIGKFYATGSWNYGYPVHLYVAHECQCGKTRNIPISSTLCHGFRYISGFPTLTFVCDI